jgi:hypothetical protein
MSRLMIRFATSTSYTLEQVLVEPVTMIVQIMDEWGDHHGHSTLKSTMEQVWYHLFHLGMQQKVSSSDQSLLHS